MCLCELLKLGTTSLPFEIQGTISFLKICLWNYFHSNHFFIIIIDLRERDWFAVPLIYAFIGWFFYVAWPGIKPVTLVYQDDALTNWATRAGPIQTMSYIIVEKIKPNSHSLSLKSNEKEKYASDIKLLI